MASKTQPFGFARKLINAWAMLGGVVLAAIVGVNVWTVIGRLIGMPFTGDFDLTQMCVAAAAFMFLPYCQLHRQNVTADIFTSNLAPRWRRALDAVAAAVAFAIAGLLLWRMSIGMMDQIAYKLSSTILQIPIWWAYVPIVASLFLMVVAAFITLTDEIRGVS